jgi:hypothetical protein
LRLCTRFEVISPLQQEHLELATIGDGFLAEALAFGGRLRAGIVHMRLSPQSQKFAPPFVERAIQLVEKGGGETDLVKRRRETASHGSQGVNSRSMVIHSPAFPPQRFACLFSSRAIKPVRLVKRPSFTVL